MGNNLHTYEFPNVADRINKGNFSYIRYEADDRQPFDITVHISQYLTRTASSQISALLADLIDLATAVYVADRLTSRKDNKTQRILVKLPLRSYELRTQISIHETLHDLLYWFTEDLWSFQFLPYRDDSTDLSQLSLPWILDDYPTRIALWSGGLDAIAGLYHQLKQDSFHYTLFGTGGNNVALGRQKALYQQMKQHFPGRLKFIQIPLQMNKRGLQTDSSSRARGFVFLVLGAVCAILEKQQTLYIHENGIGAINLPFRDCEVGLDHSRSVNPLSLSRMGKFLTDILGEHFSFENPFLFETKASICESLLKEEPELAFKTISCDSWHHRTPPQCGYCSSCLLRRQAIGVFHVEDKTPYQITTSSGREKKNTDGVEFIAMRAQVATLQKLLKDANSWLSMVKHYPILDEILQNNVEESHEDPNLIKDRLLRLYINYVAEWKQVGDSLAQGLPTKLPIYATPQKS